MRTSLFFLFLFSYHFCISQTTSWEWSFSAVETASSEGLSAATDYKGNILVSGYFSNSSVQFDSIILSNYGLADIFIAKLNTSGNILWARSAGGNLSDRGLAVTADKNGNIYVAGYFKSSSIQFGNDVLSNAGNADIFIVKYDSSGQSLWAKSFGTDMDDEGTGIYADGNGNVVVTGYFGGSIISFDDLTLTNNGSNDMFIARFDDMGNVLWAKSHGGANDERGTSICTDLNGNALVTGWFNSSELIVESDTFNNAGDYDFFNIKYDSTGNILWAKSEGGIATDIIYSVASDADGNYFETGYFNSSSLTIGSTTLNGGLDRILIIKYDSSGNALWAKRYGGNCTDRGFGIAADSDGNFYVAGVFCSNSLNFSSTYLTNAGGLDIFLAKFNHDAVFQWAKSAGGTKYDWTFGLAADTAGNAIITGSFYSPSINFGSANITNNDITMSDLFIAKMNSDGTDVQDEKILNEIKVFPNAFDNYFTLRIPEYATADFTIYNIFGQFLLQQKITGHYSTINLSSYPSAVYLLKVIIDGQIHLFRMIKN